MPDQPKPNVFALEFLDQVGKREPQPMTTAEATWAGPWRVVPLGKAFAVVRESDAERRGLHSHAERGNERKWHPNGWYRSKTDEDWFRD